MKYSAALRIIVLQIFLQFIFSFSPPPLFFFLFPSEKRVQADVWAGFNFMPLLLSGPCRMGHATRLQRDAAPLLCNSPPWHLSRLFRHDVYLLVKIRLSSECLCKGTINIDWEVQPVAAIRRPGPRAGIVPSGPFYRRGTGAAVGSELLGVPLVPDGPSGLCRDISARWPGQPAAVPVCPLRAL